MRQARRSLSERADGCETTGMSDAWAQALVAQAANCPGDTVFQRPDRTVHLSKSEAIGFLDATPGRS